MTEYRDCAICGAATETENLSLARTSVGDMGLCVHCYLAYRIGYNTRQVHAEGETEHAELPAPYKPGDEVMSYYKITAIRTEYGVHELDYKDTRDGTAGQVGIPLTGGDRGQWLVQAEIKAQAYKKRIAELEGKP